MLGGWPVVSSLLDRSVLVRHFAGLYDFLGHQFPHRDEGYIPFVLRVELFEPFAKKRVSQVASCTRNGSSECIHCVSTPTMSV